MCGKTSMCNGPHADFPRRATLLAQKGGRPITEATTSGAAPTRGVTPYTTYGARRAVGTHNGPTRMHQATAYAIGGTATLALRDCVISATTAGHIHYQ